MKRITLIILSAGLFAGCARFSTKQIQLDTIDENGLLLSRQTSTKIAAWTFFSARAQLATSKATQTDKSQGATLGGLSGEGGVNAELINSAVNAAVTAAVRATTIP